MNEKRSFFRLSANTEVSAVAKVAMFAKVGRGLAGKMHSSLRKCENESRRGSSCVRVGAGLERQLPRRLAEDELRRGVVVPQRNLRRFGAGLQLASVGGVREDDHRSPSSSRGTLTV